MRASNIEEIREHLKKGGRVNAYFKRRYGYSQKIDEVILVDGMYIKIGSGLYTPFTSPDINYYELVPIEEETEKAWHRKQVENRLKKMPDWQTRAVDSALPKIHIGNTNMNPEQQQLYYAALRIASDLKYLKDQLTEKKVEDNPRLIMLALDSISIRAEALQDALARNQVVK